ncbi:MAG: hypothetical protein LBH18_03820 [Spirochaetaceae bacterium]|jgi:hypothetical protein|nr:hypothetical protein [Spirochaetaceae bacterium]
MTTTLRQAKLLKALGFNSPTAQFYRTEPGKEGKIHFSCGGPIDYNSNPYAADKYPRISAPSVADALQWMEEAKEIEWRIDSLPVVGRIVSYFDKNRKKYFIGSLGSAHSSEQEPALLDEILKHLTNSDCLTK